MKRTFFRIVFLLAVIAGAVLALIQRSRVYRMSRISVRTAGVLPALRGIDPEEIVLSWNDFITTLRKKNGKWTLAERPGVPVNQRKVGLLLNELARLRVSKIITPADHETMKRLRVIPSGEKTDGIPGVRLILKDRAGAVLLDLVMGRGHFVRIPGQMNAGNDRSPDGRYYAVRKNGVSSVFLSSSSLESFHPAPGSWIRSPNPVLLQRTQSIAYREIPRLQPVWMIYRRDPEDQFLPFGMIRDVRVNPQSVQTIFSLLGSQFVTDARSAEKCGDAESPFASLEIVSAEGLKQILTFRKIRGDSERVLFSLRADASGMRKQKGMDSAKLEKQLNAGLENVWFEIPENLFNMLKTAPFDAIKKSAK